MFTGSTAIHARINDAYELQQLAIKRIENYIDQFRRTFDPTTHRVELMQAAHELNESIELFTQADARKDAAHSMVKLGDVHRYLNEWDAAIRTYELAARKASTANALDMKSKALLGNARAHLYGKKRSSPALRLVHQALPLVRQANDPSALFDAWDLLAQGQIAEGDYVGAADSMNRAFAVKTAINDEKLLFFGYLNRADVYQHFAEKCDYERDFKSCLDAVGRAQRDYESAYMIATRLGWDGLAQQTQGFITRLKLREQLIHSQQDMHTLIAKHNIFSPNDASEIVVSKQFTTGENPHLSEVFAWIESQGGLPPLNDARGAYIKGLLNEAGGRRDDAMDWYLRAVELLNEDRSFLHDERARGTFIENKIEFYYTTILNLLDRGRSREAFELMEQSRSRVMSDLLATKNIALSSPSERSLYANILNLRGEIAQLQSCLFAIRTEKDASASCQSIRQFKNKNDGLDRGVVISDDADIQSRIDATKLEAVLDQRQNEYTVIRNRMAQETPKLLQLVTSTPVSLEMLQKTLADDGSEMIAYLTLESQVLIWHIKPDSMHVHSVFLPRSTLKNKIDRMRKSLVHPNRPFDDETAHELYLYLISPILKSIQSDRLVIVPHEDLHYLPFQALQTKRGTHYLGEDYQISYALSATVLTSLQPPGIPKHSKLLAIADPSLQFAPSEVRAIGKRFNGRIVSDILPQENEIKSWLPGNELIHFAVHGSFTADEPLLSYLHLKSGNGEDGKLTAAEMYGLPLDAARLVVLSACETGNVRATHANEVIGMMRGLLFAGANALLLSAWKIDDQATAEWMQTFYIAAENQSPAAAARTAIRKLRRISSFQHPYYWSPFLLISR